ncbi:hypothetical protein HAZT_HAZT010062 [Hyalella azteca]|uniref:Uncharacterized protein n=1 Tax=Hyalella azteca TaxID=294128 RepID=A0A6A0GY59_HYAAZ|nr:hypothetical protein HAZT_HAZT010062 [Hyalella azteca]
MEDKLKGKSSGAVLHSSGAVLHSSGAVLHSSGAVLHSSGAVLHSSGAVLHSSGAVLHSSGAVLHSSGAVLHSSGAVLHSSHLHSTALCQDQRCAVLHVLCFSRSSAPGGRGPARTTRKIYARFYGVSEHIFRDWVLEFLSS